MFGRTLNTPIPIGMINIWYQNFFVTYSSIAGLNLVVATTLIFCSVHFTLIQVNLSQEQVPKILITQLPNWGITKNIKDGNKTC